MIKWDGFGKLLKQLFSIGLISCFILLGGSFVSALGARTTIGLSPEGSAVNSGYKVGLLKGGQVLTQFLGQGKSVLGLDKNIYFRRGTNGLPYAYGYSQGYYSDMVVCDALTGLNASLTNCSRNSIDKSLLKSFFSKVNNGDFVRYDYTVSDGYSASMGCRSSQRRFAVCWSSDEIGYTLCFNNSSCYNGCQNGVNACNNRCNNWGGCGGSYYNSQDYAINAFGDVLNSRIGKAPGQYGYDGSYEGGGSQGSVDIGQGQINLTGDSVFSFCSVSSVVSLLENENGFNQYMCYGGIDDFSNYQTGTNYSPIVGSGATLPWILKFDDDFSSDSAWFTYFNNLYQRTINSDNESYKNKWTQYPAVYKTWFDIFYEYGGNGFIGSIDDLREYCSLKIGSYGENSIYTGNYFSSQCQKVIDDNGSHYSSDGQFYEGVNRGLSGDKVKSNAVEFIQDFFNKAQEMIPTNYGDLGAGALPVYIIVFLCALIFFRFLMH